MVAVGAVVGAGDVGVVAVGGAVAALAAAVPVASVGNAAVGGTVAVDAGSLLCILRLRLPC